jgi:hypothetical protein
VLASQNVPESVIRKHFGWTPQSAMVERYLHLSGRDVDSKVLEAAGVKVPLAENREPRLKPVECPICHQANDPTMSYCTKCSCSLLSDVSTFADQVIDKVAANLMARAMDTSEVRRIREDNPGTVEKIEEDSAKYLAMKIQMMLRQASTVPLVLKDRRKDHQVGH